MFDAVIFDLDGTLLDTERLSHAAEIDAFASLGIDIDPAFLDGLVGKDDVTCDGLIRAAFPQLVPGSHRAAMAREVDRQLALQGMPLKPGTEELLARIGQPMAIATSSTRRQADRKLAMTSIARHFAHVVVFEDVRLPKPAPEPYLLAAARLGVAPARCLAFEDSEVGARSAHAAGMTVVQVPDIVPVSGEHAHLVAPDLLAGARAIGLISG